MKVSDLKSHGMSYLATPYSKYFGGLDAAWVDACRLTARIAKFGVPIFSPIVHGHPLSMHGGIDPLDGDFWIKLDDFYMDRCDALIVAQMQGWKDSIGVQYELDIFLDADKPVYFIEPETLVLESYSTFHSLGSITNRVLANITRKDAAE